MVEVKWQASLTVVSPARRLGCSVVDCVASERESRRGGEVFRVRKGESGESCKVLPMCLGHATEGERVTS